jgi:hypothetical protein
MLTVTQILFPYIGGRTAIISCSQFPALLKQLNPMDVLILNFKYYPFGSFSDHSRSILPFLLNIEALDIRWIIATPFQEGISNLYRDYPQFVLIEETEMVYVASDLNIFHDYRTLLMYLYAKQHKIPPSHLVKIVRRTKDLIIYLAKLSREP